MLSGIIGSLIGFGGSVLPSVVEHFKSKADRKHELDMLEKTAELKKQGYDHELTLVDVKASGDEHSRLVDHDIAISKGSGFISGLQRSVRPVITYCFFLLFATIEVVLLKQAIESGMSIDDAILILWDDDTKAIFAAIISFWFGSRAIDKARKFMV